MYQPTASSVCLLIASALCVLGEEDLRQAGHWGPWTEASPCTVTCGQGSQRIVRHWVPGPNDGIEASNFTKEHVYSCSSNENPECPTDGRWSGWYMVGECSVMCGKGKQDHERQCMGLVGAGKQCEGAKRKSVDCNKGPCPRLPKNFDMSKCATDSFTCESKQMCVPSAERCDSVVQCHDGTDEKNCPHRSRSRYRYGRNTASVNFTFQWMLVASVSTIFAAILLH